MSCEIIWEPKGVLQRFHGHCNDADMGTSLSAIAGDSRFDEIRYVIYDFLEIGHCCCAEDSIHETAAVMFAASATNQKIRVAIVATQARVVAWAPDFIDISGMRLQTRLFSTLADARAWATGPRA